MRVLKIIGTIKILSVNNLNENPEAVVRLRDVMRMGRHIPQLPEHQTKQFWFRASKLNEILRQLDQHIFTSAAPLEKSAILRSPGGETFCRHIEKQLLETIEMIVEISRRNADFPTQTTGGDRLNRLRLKETAGCSHKARLDITLVIRPLPRTIAQASPGGDLYHLA
jgi:hypothetical protein